MLAASFVGDLGICPAERGIEDARLHLNRRWRLVERSAIELARLPRAQSFLQLFGELVRISRSLERERRQIPAN